MAKGVYKNKVRDGTEYAAIDYGTGPIEIPKYKYEQRAYKPPYDQLITRAAYEAQQAAAAPPEAEAPKVEAPKVEAPKAEAPKVDAAKVAPPKVAPPRVEPPKVQPYRAGYLPPRR